MISMGIYLVVFLGVMVAIQVFGLRVYTLAATKLTATADARKTLNALRTQIRAAKIVYVGNYTNSSFSRISNGAPQIGNALELYFADTNTDPHETPVIYYQDSSGTTNMLYSISNGVTGVVAMYLTNYAVFAAEDYRTNILTTYQNNPVIRVTMDFSQWEYPIGYVGNNALNAYDYYRLQTRVARRAKQ